jgi:2-hydroxychromene-2-carboxylate isomerase
MLRAMRSVDVDFDYLSGFAYLASREITESLRRAEARAVFRPISFPALLGHWDQSGQRAGSNEIKQRLREETERAIARAMFSAFHVSCVKCPVLSSGLSC